MLNAKPALCKERKKMNKLDTVPCYICNKEIDLDDSVWASSKGDVNNPLYAYCVPCLPAQKESY
jgi:hypothetical protein